MPNPIKYNASSESLALKSGNFYIATGDVDRGPTNITGYYNGITPPSGGYTIYLNKASDGPSIYVANNDSQLISLTNVLAGGATYTTVGQCLSYYITQSDKVCLNRDIEPVLTNGLIFYLDPGFSPSYPASSSTLYDLGPNVNNNGTLVNGTIYSSNFGGSLVFDGVDDALIFATSSLFKLSGPNTVSFWCRYEALARCVGPFGGPWSIGIRSNRTVNFEIAPGGQISDTPFTLSEAELPLNTWGMLTCVGTTNSCDGYWNGVYRGSIPFPFPPAELYSVEPSLSISNRGSLGPFMIYNRTLTSAEVLQNFNAQKARFGL